MVFKRKTYSYSEKLKIMRYIILALALLFSSVSYCQTEYQFKIKNDVNFRDKPSANSNIIRVLNKDEIVKVSDSINNWYKLTDDKFNVGYVSKNYVDKIKVEPPNEPSASIFGQIFGFVIVFFLGYLWIFRKLPSFRSKNTKKPKEETKQRTQIKANRRLKKSKDQDLFLLENLIFPNIKGVDYSNIEANSSNIQKSLQDDVNGKWYYSQSPMICLMKSVSSSIFGDELDKLLSANNLKYSDHGIRNNVKYWDFEVENISKDMDKSPVKFSIEAFSSEEISMITIINGSMVNQESIKLRETKLSTKKHNEDWVKGFSVFDGNELMSKDNTLFKAQNVPLLFNDKDSDLVYILIPYISHISIAKLIIDEIIKENGGIESFKKLEAEGWEYLHSCNNFNIGYLAEHAVVRLNRLNAVEEKKVKTNQKIKSTKELNGSLDSISTDWHQIITNRANFNDVRRKIKGLKEINNFWQLAQGHKDEYMLKYNNGEMDVEGIEYRIDIYNSFILEFEKYFYHYQASNKKIPNAVYSKFLALIESLAGAELTKILMKGEGEDAEIESIYKRIKRPNDDTIENPNDKDFVDKDEFTHYKGYLFNGIWVENFDNETTYTPFRFGLKHGIEEWKYKNGQLKGKYKYFNDQSIEIIEEYNEDGSEKKDDDQANDQSQTSQDSKTFFIHQIHSKGTLINQFEEGYGIAFFEEAPKEAEQRAQRHILYAIDAEEIQERDPDFDLENDDINEVLGWDDIIEVYYIEGYLGVEDPKNCFILGIDVDDHREIESDYAYNWNGYGEDDSGVSKAKSYEEACELLDSYIKKYAKGKKEKFNSSAKKEVKKNDKNIFIESAEDIKKMNLYIIKTERWYIEEQQYILLGVQNYDFSTANLDTFDTFPDIKGMNNWAFANWLNNTAMDEGYNLKEYLEYYFNVETKDYWEIEELYECKFTIKSKVVEDDTIKKLTDEDAAELFGNKNFKQANKRVQPDFEKDKYFLTVEEANNSLKKEFPFHN